MSSSSLSHSHRRKHSGELGVFEASQYFSDHPEGGGPRWAERKSLVPHDHQPRVLMASNPNPRPEPNMHIREKLIKCGGRQPSSPGGKLAGFLNSFFQQYSAVKKKKPMKQTTPMKTGEEVKKSASSSSSSSQSTVMTCYNSSSSSLSPSSSSSNFHEYRKREEYRLRVRLRLGDELNITLNEEEHEGEEEDDEDQVVIHDGDYDGESSDSSSDLFELKNFDYVGLPVYGSTRMGEVIKGGSLAGTVAY